MSAAEIALTGIESKVWLLFTHSCASLYAGVSTSVLREVCSYVCNRMLLPCVSGDQLNLLDLETGLTRKTRLPWFFQTRALFCVGDYPPSAKTVRIDVVSNQLAEEEEMCEARAYCGLVAHGDSLYVFGGSRTCPLTTCEQFRAGAWTRLRDMHCARAAFSPCVVSTCIYLVSSGSMEVFETVSGTFRELPVVLQPSSQGSVTFFMSDALWTVTQSRSLVHWQVGSAKASCERVDFNSRNAGATNCTPVVKGSTAYWSNPENGRLIIFRPSTLLVWEVTQLHTPGLVWAAVCQQ